MMAASAGRSTRCHLLYPARRCRPACRRRRRSLACAGGRPFGHGLPAAGRPCCVASAPHRSPLCLEWSNAFGKPSGDPVPGSLVTRLACAALIGS
jgi:hypothetical protein